MSSAVLTYKGYSTSMEYDADDKIYVGKLLHINDTVSFHAQTYEGFETAFREAVEDYIETRTAIDNGTAQYEQRT